MRVMRHASWLLVGLSVVITACAPQGSGGQSSTNPAARPGTPKRIVAAVQDDIPMVFQKLNPASRFRGVDGVQDLVAAGLTQQGKDGNSIPELAEAVPSSDIGLWKVAADGSMETTWHIKPGAQWHDGAPFTTADLVFTLQVARDKDLPIFSEAAHDYITDVVAVDPQTVTVKWKQPY